MINECPDIVAIMALLLVAPPIGLTAAKLPQHRVVDKSRPIRVVGPNQLPATLPAKPIHFEPGYKPTMARLPNGSMVMLNFYSEENDGYHEYGMICRSTDNGQTWSQLVRVKLSPGQDMLGRENWLAAIDDGTQRGLLFTTNHIIRADIQNPTPGVCRSAGTPSD